MDFTAATIIWICVVAFAASFTQSLTGFGFAVICTPLLSTVLAVKTGIPVTTVCGGAATVPIIFALRRQVLWKPVLVLALSAAPGIWLGAKWLSHVPDAWIAGAMGVMLVALGVFQLRGGRVPLAWRGRWLGVACGFLSGAIGASTAAPGPPVIAYTSVQDWDVRTGKAVMNVYFLLQALIVIPVYWAHGLLTREVGVTCAWAAPMVAAGLACGMWVSHLLRERVPLMRRIIYATVLLLGVYMLAKALL